MLQFNDDKLLARESMVAVGVIPSTGIWKYANSTMTYSGDGLNPDILFSGA